MTSEVMDKKSVHPSKADQAAEQWETIKSFCASRNWPTESSLRAMLNRAHELGLEDAFIRVGRRVLVNGPKLWCLLKTNNRKQLKGSEREALQSNDKGKPRL